MKTFTGLLSAIATASIAYAGPEPSADKEMIPRAASSIQVQSWYADQEWDLSLWSAYALIGTNNERNSLSDTFSKQIGAGTYDRFLGGDHAFGGGADLKYFLRRYFAIGIEGFALAGQGTTYTVENFGATAAFKRDDDHLVGGALATLTLRYPIGYTRFSPYVWAGGGGIFGGHNQTAIYASGALERISHDVESRGTGQFGGGLELRITRHIGVTNDVSWNVLDGRDNNFGLVRTGLIFSF